MGYSEEDRERINEDSYLQTALLMQKVIDMQELNRIRMSIDENEAKGGTKKKLSEILIEKGLLTPEKLKEVMAKQVELDRESKKLFIKYY